MRSRVFIQPGQLRYGRFGDGSGTGSSGTFGGGNPLAPWGPAGGRSTDPAPLQLTEPWTEYVTTSGTLGTANVLSNPPWQVNASPTASQPVHIIAAADVHSNDAANQADQCTTSLSYTTDQLAHVDVTKPFRMRWSMKFQSDPSGFNSGGRAAQFGVAFGGGISMNVITDCNGGASSISSNATGGTGTFNYTDDFSIRSFIMDVAGSNTGGAGKNKVSVQMNGVTVYSGVFNNMNNGGGGPAITLSPAFTCRVGNRVFNLFALKLYYVKM